MHKHIFIGVCHLCHSMKYIWILITYYKVLYAHMWCFSFSVFLFLLNTLGVHHSWACCISITIILTCLYCFPIIIPLSRINLQLRVTYLIFDRYFLFFIFRQTGHNVCIMSETSTQGSSYMADQWPVQTRWLISGQCKHAGWPVASANTLADQWPVQTHWLTSGQCIHAVPVSDEKRPWISTESKFHKAILWLTFITVF